MSLFWNKATRINALIAESAKQPEASTRRTPAAAAKGKQQAAPARRTRITVQVDPSLVLEQYKDFRPAKLTVELGGVHKEVSSLYAIFDNVSPGEYRGSAELTIAHEDGSRVTCGPIIFPVHHQNSAEKVMLFMTPDDCKEEEPQKEQEGVQ